jgi:hypothetical protein
MTETRTGGSDTVSTRPQETSPPSSRFRSAA